MSVTVTNLLSNLNTFIGDSSEDRLSNTERYQALTESVAWLLEELGNDHAVKTYDLGFVDTVHYYKVTNSVADILASADLRRGVKDQTISALPKSAKQIAVDIGQRALDFAWAIERRDDDTYIVVNLDSKNKAKLVADFDSIVAGGGTWLADTITSDATNITIDTVEKIQGTGSLNFDIDVSQSGNNVATIYNDTLGSLDLAANEDLGAWLFSVYLPDVTYVNSITFTFGTDDSNYWSYTQTADIDGAAFHDGWNDIRIDWRDCTTTGTPNASDVAYIKFDFNYDGTQSDDTDFRIDWLRIANPERLTFHYVSWDVGKDNTGAEITAFAAGTDVPFFSGKYDQYKYPVAHKAASILFYGPLRLREEGQSEENAAIAALQRARKIFPVSKSNETSSFKVYGVNFGRRGGRVRLRGF